MFSASFATYLAPHVGLFPLPGFTPGTCGLLLAYPHATTFIAGDAVATAEHLERGQVLRGAFDIEKAQESLLEVIEIADRTSLGTTTSWPRRVSHVRGKAFF